MLVYIVHQEIKFTVETRSNCDEELALNFFFGYLSGCSFLVDVLEENSTFHSRES